VTYALPLVVLIESDGVAVRTLVLLDPISPVIEVRLTDPVAVNVEAATPVMLLA